MQAKVCWLWHSKLFIDIWQDRFLDLSEQPCRQYISINLPWRQFSYPILPLRLTCVYDTTNYWKIFDKTDCPICRKAKSFSGFKDVEMPSNQITSWTNLRFPLHLFFKNWTCLKFMYFLRIILMLTLLLLMSGLNTTWYKYK